jgi:two-component system cell cycle sensor histidine kinase/response regulator CckA
LTETSDPNILVVDDDSSMLEFALAALDRLGYVAVGRSDPEGALDVVKSTPSLQVLLSDICLGPITGPELIRQALRDRPELKVVFMSGGFDNVSFRRTDPVLDKPFRLDGLQKALDSVLNDQQPQSEQAPAGTERRRSIA